MSYILDALKKLEQEKSRKSRGSGVINISGALFENESPKLSGTAGWKIAVAVAVAVLVTFSATWLFFKSGKGRENQSTHLAPPVPRAAPIPPAAVVTAPAPPVPQVLPVQQTPQAALPIPAKVPPPRPPVSSSNSKKAVAQSATATEDAAALLTMQELRKHTKESKVQSLPSEQAMAAPADIKLSGIAWQEEHRDRRAVVNGYLMQEGGVVSGAKITDIFQDRVRFSLAGKIFEIPLTSAGVPAAGK